ncbi:MAG: serine--tRNA ligase [bacterium]|nr:serine--tRNA ligase [bacterium]
MLDIKLIRQNPEKVKDACRKKQAKIDIDRLLEIDKKRKELMLALEDTRAKKNQANEQIKQLHDKADREAVIMKMQELDKSDDRIEAEFKEIDAEFQGLMSIIPNLPLNSVPEGKDESENKEIRKWGDIPKFNFPPKSHFELGETLDLIDTQRAGKVSGTRFGYLKNEGVMLEMALLDLGFKTLIKKGFTPILPPAMIQKDVLMALGYNNRGFEETYCLDQDNLCLVATAEHAIVPYFKDEILLEQELPKRFVGFSAAFRREAGSYGKDTKGILRVHQFNKLEMVSFVKPEDSEKEHAFLIAIEEELMQSLNLPYHVVQMCTGDLGDPAAAKYDIEAWFPSENKYRETHSASNCTDYQARRLNIRFKRKGGELEFVHILNGTVFSERPILAILENYQQKDGSIKVPRILQKYTCFKEIR